MRRLVNLAGRAVDVLLPGAFLLRRGRTVAGTLLLTVSLAFTSALAHYHTTGRQALSPLRQQWYRFDPGTSFMGQALESGEELIALNVQPRSHSITRVSAIWPQDTRTVYTRLKGAARAYHFGFAFLLLSNALLVSVYARKR